MTATAKSSNTVIMVTTMSTKASAFGICLIRLSEENSNVPILTINIIPTSTATGIEAITSEKFTTSTISSKAAVIEESRPRPPEVKLITDCPIMAHPAIPPKNPEVTLPIPSAIHSWLPFPLAPPISSSTESVSRDSINPTSATINAIGKIISIEVQEKSVLSGITNVGIDTCERSAKSPTVLVSI